MTPAQSLTIFPLDDYQTLLSNLWSICIFREWKGIPILSWNKKFPWGFSSQRKVICTFFFSPKKSFLGRRESLPVGNQKNTWLSKPTIFREVYEEESSEHFLSFYLGAQEMAHGTSLILWSCTPQPGMQVGDVEFVWPWLQLPLFNLEPKAKTSNLL